MFIVSSLARSVPCRHRPSRPRPFISIALCTTLLFTAGLTSAGATAVATTSTFTAVHDTWVGPAEPNRNYASGVGLRLGGDPVANRVYLTFQLSGVTNPTSARLSLNVSDAGAQGGTVYDVPSKWSGSAMSWNTARALGTSIGRLGTTSKGAWVDVALSVSVVRDGTFTVAIDAGTSDRVIYSSREAGNAPRLEVTSNTQPAGTTSPPSSGGGIWLTPAEIAALPMSGTPWRNVKAVADSNIGGANLADQDSHHDIRTLAVALVAARTGEPSYRNKAVTNIMSAIGTDNNHDPDCTSTPNRARSMSLGRNLAGYVIAADVINLRRDSDPNSNGSRFAAWVSGVRLKQNCPNTGSVDGVDASWWNLSQVHDGSGSNGSAMAGGARLAAAMYLGDTSEVTRAWQTFRRYSGDRATGPDLSFNGSGLTWSHSSSAPVAINPAGSTKNGHRIDGAIINDIGRGATFRWPPVYTQYNWEGTAGYFVQAQLLQHAGYPSWTVEDSAPRRVMEFNRYLAEQFGSRWWDHSDWTKYMANKVYGLHLPIGGPANSGRNMAWTDWTHGS